MLGFPTKPQNGVVTTQEKYLKRLEEVLGGIGDAPGDHPADLAGPQDVEEMLKQAEEPAPLDPGPALATAKAAQDQAVPDLDEAARKIAGTLMGALAQVVRDVHRKVESKHSALETTAVTVSRLSADVAQAAGQLAVLSTKAEEAALEQALLGSRSVEFGDRLSLVEQNSKRISERLDEIVAGQEAATRQIQGCANSLAALDARVVEICQRLEIVQSTVESQATAGARLNSLYEKLDQFSQSLSGQIEAHEKLIHALRSEVKQPTGVVERILGVLKGIDLRQEDRFPFDAPIKVRVDGESDGVNYGRIVNASERGLGLSMEKPLLIGTSIQVEVNNSLLAGKVLYSLPQGDRHAAGVRLSQPLPGVPGWPKRAA